MTSLTDQRPASSSGLSGQAHRLLRLVGMLVSLELDRSFALSSSGARRRKVQAVLLSVLFMVVAFGVHALLRSSLGGIEASATDTSPLVPDALITAWRIFLMLGIATSLAVHAAGRFVADVFELKDARVAWRFISRLATGSQAEVLRLREGRLSDDDRKSPIVQIGGPGHVVVDYDTAALFEGPDGSPHVVGAAATTSPGGGGSQAVIQLGGFERLREPVISLRDQYVGEPSGPPLTVVGRSLDGMPISVTDVRAMFSVRRHGSAATTHASPGQPFPFRARDIENLIYNQAVEVLVSEDHASSTPGDWTAAMHELIRDSLREFMALNRLSEFLAGVGANEAERSEFRADAILSRTLQISTEVPGIPSPRPASAPQLRPRTELSAKFRKYGSEFSTRAQELGVELHWIGVGTWKMPDQSSEDVVSTKHIEAWRMNRENAERLKSQALERITEDSLLRHKLHLIQEVPIARHAINQARYSDKTILMECLLLDFLDQLGDALDIHYRAGTPSTDLSELEDAVSKLERITRMSEMGHVLGSGTPSRIRRREEWDKSLDGPPAPASRSEALQYQALLAKLQGDFRVAEAMILNEKRRHSDLSREQLISRIVERFERHGR